MVVIPRCILEGRDQLNLRQVTGVARFRGKTQVGQEKTGGHLRAGVKCFRRLTGMGFDQQNKNAQQ